MSEKTGIEWATHTASPWFGCSKVSAGCTFCYAETLTLQKKWAGWGDNSPRVRSKGFWKDAYRYDRQAAKAEQDRCREMSDMFVDEPYERPRMFTSLMDWLDLKAPVAWLADFLKVIHDCQNLDWLLLTKRPENFSRVRDALDSLHECSAEFETWVMQWMDGYPPENVWFGVTVENQEMADKRIPILFKIPARIRWLSVEPLLEKVDLSNGALRNAYSVPTDRDSHGHGIEWTDPGDAFVGVDWVVVGGESGQKRRDCGADAISNVAYQCLNAGVPCFVKQDCARLPGQRGRLSDHVWALKQYPK